MRGYKLLECRATGLGDVQKVYWTLRLIYRNGVGELFRMRSLWARANHFELANFMWGITGSMIIVIPAPALKSREAETAANTINRPIRHVHKPINWLCRCPYLLDDLREAKRISFQVFHEM
jgi:hypothetical protein